MSLSRKQIALIHVAKKKLNLTGEHYRGILNAIAGVESSKDLDQTGFELVMRHMIALGFSDDFAKTFYGHRAAWRPPARFR